MKKKIKYLTLVILFLSSLFTSCSSVKPYQKTYLNDEDMSLSSKSSEQFETNFQNYREGASGANGGKTGGGCGCN